MDITELKKRIARRRAMLARGVIFGLFALAGSMAVQMSSAATYSVDQELETGGVTTPAITADDELASGGSAVRFQAAPPPPPVGSGFSLRFFGTQTNDIDRVKIPLTPNKSVDVGGNFTLEWWMKTTSGNTMGGACQSGSSVVWIYGNIIWDRDINGGGDYGDYGISVFNDGRLSFGVENSGGASTLCSTVAVNDGQWHHVAATRNTSSGQLCLYIDGAQRGCRSGPTGDMSYRDGRSTGQPDSDPFLVIAAEKHDFWGFDQGYHGWVDEARISTSVRYTADFSRPTGQFTADGSTAALYHFDSGSGTTAVDETAANPGTVKVGGNPAGPQWSSDTPW